MKRDDDVAAGYRHARLQALVLEELRAILRDAVQDPAVADVHLTNLALSVDYRHARVHFTLPTGGTSRRDADRALVRATPYLRAQVAVAVELKRTPDFRFVFDGMAATPVTRDDDDTEAEL
jgi:ribosome-binding factor A